MRLTDEQRRIAEDNHNLIYGFLNKNHLDYEEWYDIIAMGYLNAVLKFDPARGSLSTLAYKVMQNQYKMELLRRNRSKHKGNCISLYTPIGDEGMELKDTIADPINLEDQCVARINLDADLRRLKDRQRLMLKMVLDGFSQVEIGQTLQVCKQAVNRTIRGIGRKLKTAASSNNAELGD